MNQPVLFLVGLSCLVINAAYGGGVVTQATEGDLRAALAGGGTVTFSVDGIITVSNTMVLTNNTVIDGTGHSVTLSGGDAVRVLTVPAGVSLSLTNITVAHGRDLGLNVTNAPGGLGAGGGIWVAGNLTAIGCRFWTNAAMGGAAYVATFGDPLGPGGDGQGGALCVLDGQVALQDCEFSGNYVEGGGIPSPDDLSGLAGNGFGGAIFQSGGSVDLNRCHLLQNLASAGVAKGVFTVYGWPRAGRSYGGALYIDRGTARILSCTFHGNLGTPLAPYSNTVYLVGGEAAGGAIYQTNSNVTLSESLFEGNMAIGGPSKYHNSSGVGRGGAICNEGTLMVTNCSFFTNLASPGEGFFGSPGQGGAFYNNSLAVVRGSRFSSNSVSIQLVNVAGDHNNSPSAQGGAIHNSGELVLLDSTVDSNIARAGDSVNGYILPIPVNAADACGGGLFNSGTLSIVNSTFSYNATFGGNGRAPAHSGNGYGGALYNTEGVVHLTFCTFALDAANGGSSELGGAGFGAELATATTTNVTTTLEGCILLNGSQVPNNFGSLIDDGYNLSSDASCNFTRVGSLNSTDPKLGPLADNGGRTPTCALLPGSPAIDAAKTSSAPAADQRGVMRPQGTAADIGAYEYSVSGSTGPKISLSRSANNLALSLMGETGKQYRLLVSIDLAVWHPVLTNSVASAGPLKFERPISSDHSEFYRIEVVP